MTTTEKEQVNELADALLADALQSDNATDLYNSLVRFEVGVNALTAYIKVKEGSK